MARICNRMILCANVCDQTQPVGIIIGIMLGVYTALEKADHKPIFGPILAKALGTVLPKSGIGVKKVLLI